MKLVHQLAVALNQPEEKITLLLQRAPLHYKVYQIPKRTSGTRTIAQPTPELKALQRAFTTLVALPVHQAAIAYRAGLSIKENAQRHKHNRYLLKLDLHNFFNSITPAIFWHEWQHFFAPLEDSEKQHIEHLLFWAPRKTLHSRWVLSVGAPSSPCVSNFVMYRFDEKLQAYCNNQQITYTRYADDLTFSTRKTNILFELPGIVAQLLEAQFGGRITLNKRKTVFSSKAHNRHITGIVITNEGKLSLGRAKKRYLKHLVHQFLCGQLALEEIAQLRGWLAFAQHIEPSFIRSLQAKYGSAVMQKINEVGHAK